jgi:nitrogen fixation protein NifU and related proteins
MEYHPSGTDAAHERLLDHARNPRGRGLLQPSDARARDLNPLCGDWVEVSLRFDAHGKVAEVGFEGVGCSVSQAAASMLFEAVRGRPRESLQAISDAEVYGLLGVELNNNRKKCAQVALRVLKQAAAPEQGVLPGGNRNP